MLKITQTTQLQILFIILLFCSTTVFAQVGIGNNNPQSVLDISSSNQTNPANTDGILIPRIDNFPAANPGATQDGMLVFVTGLGTPTKGFYYWEQSTTSWIPFGGGSTNDWTLGGNTITNVTTEYIGTNSNHDFRVRTNGAQRFNFSSNGRLRSFSNGTVAEPTYSWNNDTNMGMYRINTDILGFSTNAIERMRIDENGSVSVNGTALLAQDKLSTFVTTGTGYGIVAENTATGEAGYFNTNSNNSNSFPTVEIDQQNNSGGSVLDLEHWSTTNNSIGLSVSVGSNNDRWGIYSEDEVLALDYWLISDKRLKSNINGLTNALEKIKDLNPVTYNFNSSEFKSINQKDLNFGFLAQEIKQVLPDLVAENSVIDPNVFGKNVKRGLGFSESDFKFDSVNYLGLIPILTKGIQEQQQIIESQNDKIKILEKKLADLEAKVNSLLEN